MATPATRGWGDPGIPGSAVGREYERDHIVTISAGGIRLRVHHIAAPLFAGFCDSLVAHKPPYALNKVADDWGYAHRYIRGSRTTLSNHSWGLAVDLNATTNPMTSDGKVHTDMPAWVIVAATRWGLFWGGNYKASGRRDPMHFEYLGRPEQIASIVAKANGAS